MIALSAVVAGFESVRRLFDPREIDHVGVVIAAGLIGFAGNELVAVYRIRVGRAIGSAALVADGLHARTDGFTSLAVVAGALGVLAGWDAADPVVGLLITVAILFVLRSAATDIYRRLMDAVDPELVEAAEASLRATPGRARGRGGAAALDRPPHPGGGRARRRRRPRAWSRPTQVATDAHHRLLHDVKGVDDVTVARQPQQRAGTPTTTPRSPTTGRPYGTGRPVDRHLVPAGRAPGRPATSCARWCTARRTSAACTTSCSSSQAGDRVYFTDWRGDPDERLLPDGPTVGGLLRELCERDVEVRGLVWRSHTDLLQFSATENEHLGEELNEAGGEVLLDQRVRWFGSHHQKLVVLRHRGEPERDVAFVGGIDLCHGRRDDADHRGDPQQSPIDRRYGDRAPWHDATLELRGPVVGEVLRTFVERWDDPHPLDRRSPYRRLLQRLARMPRHPEQLPESFPDPPPAGRARRAAAADLRRAAARRTRSRRRASGRSRGRTRHAFRRARTLIYLEDQYLWSEPVARGIAEALERGAGAAAARRRAALPGRRRPGERAAEPARPDRGRWSCCSRWRPDRVAFFDLENADGVPIYVHAKICVVDDVWCTCGSDNFNRRSWTNDSELTCAVLDPERDEPRAARPVGRRATAPAGWPATCGSRRGPSTSTCPREQLLDPVAAWDLWQERGRRARRLARRRPAGPAAARPGAAARAGSGDARCSGCGPSRCTGPCSTPTGDLGHCAGQAGSDAGRRVGPAPVETRSAHASRWPGRSAGDGAGVRPQPAGTADDHGRAAEVRHAAEPRAAEAEGRRHARRSPPPAVAPAVEGGSAQKARLRHDDAVELGRRRSLPRGRGSAG